MSEEGKYQQDIIKSGRLDVSLISVRTGNPAALAFHGFGLSARSMLRFHEALPEHGFYSFDLPGHGNSVFPGEKSADHSLHPDELKLLFSDFFEQHRIDKVSLIGFSLGAKTALLLTLLFPERIDRLVLIAPDGLTLNPWYHFVARTALGRSVFRILLHRKRVFDLLLRIVKKLNIPDEKQAKFVFENLNTQEKREFVRFIWHIYKDISADRTTLIKTIKEHDIETLQFFGKYDHVIPSKIGRAFADDINQPQNFYELNAGHNLLKPKYIDEIVKIIRSRGIRT